MRFHFKPKGVPVIAGPWLRRALPKSVIREGPLKLEVRVEGDEVVVGPFSFPLDALDEAVEGMGDTLHAVLEEGFMPLEKRGRHYMRLRALERPGHPTLEIDGVHMHRISNTNPWKDTLSKVAPLRIRKGDKVLDTCMGLGYTAIAAKERGADVVTVEVNEQVVELAQWNPWSAGLEDVEVRLGDVAEVIREFPDETFDKVIHDPPVLQLAGHLYSREFYSELYRVLKPGGRLFHYTGAPSKSRPVNVVRGVAERLSEVGFVVTKYPKGLGVLAYKPP